MKKVEDVSYYLSTKGNKQYKEHEKKKKSVIFNPHEKIESL